VEGLNIKVGANKWGGAPPLPWAPPHHSHTRKTAVPVSDVKRLSEPLLVFTIPTRTRILFPTERQTHRITDILHQFKAIYSIRPGNNCSVPILRGRRSVIDCRAMYGTGGHRSDWANLRLWGYGGSARLSVNGHLWRHGGSRDRASCVVCAMITTEWIVLLDGRVSTLGTCTDTKQQ